MAIDRDLITKQIFNGTRHAGWTAGCPRWWTASRPAPAVTSCKFDAAEAKALYEEAGGYKGGR